MKNAVSRLLDNASSFFARRKGLLPIIGILLIVFNFILRLVSANWMTDNDLLLHLGIIIAIIGIMLHWAL